MRGNALWIIAQWHEIVGELELSTSLAKFAYDACTPQIRGLTTLNRIRRDSRYLVALIISPLQLDYTALRTQREPARVIELRYQASLLLRYRDPPPNDINCLHQLHEFTSISRVEYLGHT